ncbi:MAG TPA: hypothetical protein VHB48_20625, partial [Chitinophagaceae bacterium]|nr:hypothetical protein [Chitinophagaceae bacterium]
MDAQGNKPFWQQRCRYTPFKIFSSPATLWRAAGQYFAYMDAGTGGVPLKPGKKTAAPAGDSSPA